MGLYYFDCLFTIFVLKVKREDRIMIKGETVEESEHFHMYWND